MTTTDIGFFYDDIPTNNDIDIDEDEPNKYVSKIYDKMYMTEYVQLNIEKIKCVPCYKCFFYVPRSISRIKTNKFCLYTKSSKNNTAYSPYKEDSEMLVKYERLSESSIGYDIYVKNNVIASLTDVNANANANVDKDIQLYRIYLRMIEHYEHLLVTIQHLHDCGIFHNGIYINNIIVPTPPNILLTNFMYSIDMKELNAHDRLCCMFNDYDPSNMEIPMELHILSYMNANKMPSLSYSSIEYVINDVTSKNEILSHFGKKMADKMKCNSIDYFVKYINKPIDTIINDIISHFKTWDNYSLSIMYLRIFILMYKNVDNNHKIVKNLLQIMKLLVTNIDSCPYKRLSISDTKKRVMELSY